MISEASSNRAPMVTHKPDRPLGKDRHDIAEPDIAAFRRGKSRGCNIGQQEDLLVGQGVGNQRQVCLGMRKQEVFGLRPVNCVPEPPSAKQSPALRPVATETGFALAARSNRSRQHALAGRIAFDSKTKFMDHARSFVTKRETFSHLILAADDVNVGAANCGQADLNDGFSRTGLRNHLFLKAELPGRPKHVGVHHATGKLFRFPFFEFDDHYEIGRAHV